MKKLGILVFAAAFVVGLVVTNIFSTSLFDRPLFNFEIGFGSARGSGNIGQETRTLGAFNAIDVGGKFTVESVRGDNYSVSIEADDNLIPLIETEVSNGTLSISSKRRLRSDNAIKIRVISPAIESIEASGASTVDIADPSEKGLNIETSGVARVTASGRTQTLKIDMSGASKVFAYELEADRVTVNGSGASRAETTATVSLNSDLSGASKVSYGGSPKDVRTEASGAAKVAAR